MIAGAVQITVQDQTLYSKKPCFPWKAGWWNGRHTGLKRLFFSAACSKSPAFQAFSSANQCLKTPISPNVL
jgi:hypothetical protein